MRQTGSLSRGEGRSVLALAFLVVLAAAGYLGFVEWQEHEAQGPAAGATGFRLEQLGFGELRDQPLLDLRTAIAGHAYVDFLSDRYEAGDWGWLIVRKGSANPGERWVVRESRLASTQEGSTTASKLEVLDSLTGKVVAKRNLYAGQIEGSPPTGWINGHASTFVRGVFASKRTWSPIPRIVGPAASQYEAQLPVVQQASQGTQGDGCPSTMHPVYRHGMLRLDVGTWQLVPWGFGIRGFACSNEHVAIFSGVYSALEITIASLDSREVIAFELGTSFDWTGRNSRKFGGLVVNDSIVRFDVQEWSAARAPKVTGEGGEQVLVRMLRYEVPRKLLSNTSDSGSAEPLLRGQADGRVSFR